MTKLRNNLGSSDDILYNLLFTFTNPNNDISASPTVWSAGYVVSARTSCPGAIHLK